MNFKLKFFIFFLVFFSNLASVQANKKILLTINYKFSYIFDIAETNLEKKKGLMNIDKLKNTNGMLFTYLKPEIVKMWMKNTKFNLNISFIDESLKVNSIVNAKKLSEKIISSHIPVVAVLEIPKTCEKKLNLKVGDSINWIKLTKKEFEKLFKNNKSHFPCLY